MAIVTLCFVRKGDNYLMINRNKPPFMGMWNVLGGHLEENETVSECAIREIYEESGIKVDNVTLFSISTWNYDDDEIYVYLSTLPDDFDVSSYPKIINEGIVDFKPIKWITHPKNFGVIDDLRLFIKDIDENKKQNYHLIYNDSKLIKVEKK